MIGFKTALRQYDGRGIERLSKLPAFQELAEKYQDVRDAGEGELVRAFRESIRHEVEEALGITEESDDLGAYCH